MVLCLFSAAGMGSFGSKRIDEFTAERDTPASQGSKDETANMLGIYLYQPKSNAYVLQGHRVPQTKGRKWCCWFVSELHQASKDL